MTQPSDEATWKVSERIAREVVLGTGMPPLPPVEEIAEHLAAAINDDPMIQEANEPYRVTAEAAMPQARDLHRYLAEEMKDVLEDFDRKARAFQEEFGEPWDAPLEG